MSSQDSITANNITSLLTQFAQASKGSTTSSQVPASDEVSSIAAAFAEVVSKLAPNDEPTLTETWNGDICYAEVGRDFASKLLGFTNKLVMEEKPRASGSGSKRKAQPALPLDPTKNLSSSMTLQITSSLQELLDMIRSETDMKNRAVYTALLFIVMFRERAIVSGSRSSVGKGHRSISYLIFHTLYQEMPSTCLALIPLFAHYGYWGDMNALAAHYVDTSDMRVVNACVDAYVDDLDQTVRDLFSKGIMEKNGDVLTHSEMSSNFSSLKMKVQSMTPAELKSTYSNVYMTNAIKFIPSEGKRHDYLRMFLIARIFCDGDITKIMQRGVNFVRFAQTTFRHLTTALRCISGVVESIMSGGRWKEINPSYVPAGALNKYRKAFMNELLDTPLTLSQSETGNRTTDADRIQLRKDMIQAAIDGAMKGAGMDIIKLARLMVDIHKITATDALVIHAQFMSIVKDMKTMLHKEYDESLALWMEEGGDPATKPLSPFDVIATIDTSGSMESAKVLEPAVVIGILITMISDLGSFFITFSDNPRLVHLDTSKGTIVDWFKAANYGDWGGSTNMDGAMNLLLDLFKKVRQTRPTFDGRVNHIILTDGQFNMSGSSASPGFGYNSVYDYSTQWNTFADRMKERFTHAGFALPLTCFWNMNHTSPGFPAHGKYRGLTLAEGLSQGLLVNVLGNKVTFTKDEKTGTVVANIDPVDSFLRGLARDDFSNVVDALLLTKEGVFAHEDSHHFVKGFLSHYVKQ